jgi:hypothetical protein
MACLGALDVILGAVLTTHSLGVEHVEKSQAHQSFFHSESTREKGGKTHYLVFISHSTKDRCFRIKRSISTSWMTTLSNS